MSRFDASESAKDWLYICSSRSRSRLSFAGGSLVITTGALRLVLEAFILHLERLRLDVRGLGRSKAVVSDSDCSDVHN